MKKQKGYLIIQYYKVKKKIIEPIKNYTKKL